MTIPSEVIERVAIWDAAAIKYMAIGFGLLALSILSSASVTVFTEQLSKVSIKVLSFVAAASTALLASFNPIDLGYRFRDAWRELDSALLQYKANPEKFTADNVIQAVANGEGIIGGATRPSIKGAESTPGSSKKANEPK